MVCSSAHRDGVDLALLVLERILGLGLSDTVDLETDGDQVIDIHHTAAVEHECRLCHTVVDALVVQSLEFVPVFELCVCC